MQTKRQSLTEQLFNVGSGFVVSLIYWQIAVIPYLHYMEGAHGLAFDDPFVAVSVTMQFTVLSVARGYVWRRLFNRLHSPSIQPTR
jgi:hypothetical protein